MQALASALLLAPDRLDVWAAYARAARAAKPETRMAQLLADTVAAVRRKVEESGTRAPANLELVGEIVNPLFYRGQVNAPRLRAAVESGAATFGAEKTARDYDWLADLLAETARTLPEPQRGPALFELGAVYLVMKEWGDAETALVEAEPLLRPDLAVRARLGRSEAVSQLGRHDEALKLAASCAVSMPNAVEPQCQLARVTARSGKLDEARELYKRVLALPGLDVEMRKQIETEMRSAGVTP